NPLRGGVVMGLLRLPGLIWRLSRAMSAVKWQTATFPVLFRNEIVPPFVASAKQAMSQDWSKFDPPGLVREFETWVNRTLVEFAKDSLKPTVLADFAWNGLVEMLQPRLGAERAAVAVAELSLGAKPT